MRNYKQWSDQEILFLIDNFGKITIAKIAQKLKRKIPSIRYKMRELDLLKQDDSEKKLLKEVKKIYPYHSNAEISKILEVPISKIRYIANNHGLKKKFGKWTKAEEKIVLKYYHNGVAATIYALMLAGHEKRTRWAVINKKRELTNG